jgi:hypothetical protein
LATPECSGLLIRVGKIGVAALAELDFLLIRKKAFRER